MNPCPPGPLTGVGSFIELRNAIARIAVGQETRESLLAVQERYDTYFLASDVWRQARQR